MLTSVGRLRKMIAALLAVIAMACVPTERGSSVKDGASGPIKSLVDPRVLGFVKYLPKVDDKALNEIFADSETFWYDKYSMPHVYQDSVATVFGVRYNSAALNASRIAQGDRVFDKEGFKFPFKTAVGTDFTKDLLLINFMSLPKVNGKRLNIAHWVDNTTRWRWMFPNGTVFGEILFVKAPQGLSQAYYVTEIRTRKRYQESWEPNVFRPFTTAQELEAAITKKRPDWGSNPALLKLVNHLRNNNTLTARTLEPTQYYRVAIEPVKGALDFLPDFGDPKLVADLLTETVFKSAEGRVWKANGKLETYAPTTDANFSIVPYKYEGGLFPVNEISCNRCHEDTGRQVGDFNDATQLYGEVWGEDRIFTWHLFDENKGLSNLGLSGTFDQNRRLNRQINTAGLIEKFDPNKHTSPHYNQHKRRFKISFR